MRKVLFVCGGIAAMSLGSAGVVVPGLPTTPFLLLALFCFAKGSRKLDRWFRGTALFEKYGKQYEHDRSLTRKQKLTIQITAGLMMLISFLLTDNLVLRLLLLGALLLHNYVFIFVIRTRKTGESGKVIEDEEGDRYEL
ncbi:YbaN family protein [Lachnospiraceae bacterium 54-53]